MSVALFDGSGGACYAQLDFTGQTRVYVGFQVYRTSAQETAEGGFNATALELDSGTDAEGLVVVFDGSVESFNDYATAAGVFTADTWHTLEFVYQPDATPSTAAFDGTSGVSNSAVHVGDHVVDVAVGHFGSSGLAHGGFYIGAVWIGTDVGLHDILLEDWSSGDFSNWTSVTAGASVTTAPATPPTFVPLGSDTTPTGRVLIAFNDGPLVADPTWTRIDGGDSPFPQNFVSGYDIAVGRQTLLSQTDTGTATVYINDHDDGLFDPNNRSSPYFGLLDGAQILLQLWDPVRSVWESQFRGWIDEASYDIDGSAVGADGQPINASIQLECVDMFDFLAGFGLTPGLAGVTPPAGAEDGVYYAATSGTVDDRMIEILTDVGIDPTRYNLATGNCHVRAVKYDPNESALVALRDAADAELPFIANILCDRHGKFVFHGRYSRFDPDAVSAETTSKWDFHRWAVGDGAAIIADPTRAQMRVLSYGRGRRDVVNVAVCYPQDVLPADMPGQVYADTASIDAFGQHAAPPMSDLLNDGAAAGTPSDGDDAKTECYHFAKLLVLNQKDPVEAITALQVKSLRPDDPRATATWPLITQLDLSDIVNVAAGYPSGWGFDGTSPEDDHYVEGRQMRVRPLVPDYDYVELDLEVSPAVWSMDTHGVFPAFAPSGSLSADFSYAQ